jgi:hypothetical protein
MPNQDSKVEFVAVSGNEGHPHADGVQAPKNPYLKLYEKIQAGYFDQGVQNSEELFQVTKTLIYDAATSVGERKTNPGQDHATLSTLESLVSVFDQLVKLPEQDTNPESPEVAAADLNPVPEPVVNTELQQ